MTGISRRAHNVADATAAGLAVGAFILGTFVAPGWNLLGIAALAWICGGVGWRIRNAMLTSKRDVYRRKR